MTGLHDHLASGATTICRTWLVRRRDGVHYGFTDHDRDLTFDGQRFKASSGMTARVLQQTTGLSVDNSEALGALTDASVTEEDLLAGRFDGAEVRSWMVNWADITERVELFRGSFGEITRVAGQFRAELRGQTEALNQPQGRVYHRACSAILGDAACAFDLTRPEFATELEVVDVAGVVLQFAGMTEFAAGWFQRGRILVQSGAASGLVGVIKSDKQADTARFIELWAGLGIDLVAGDVVRLEAGCDKMADTCRVKFDNFLNFRGFPHIPGDDWMASYPTSAQPLDGGSLFL